MVPVHGSRCNLERATWNPEPNLEPGTRTWNLFMPGPSISGNRAAAGSSSGDGAAKTDSASEIDALRRKIDGIRADVYASLTPWQLVRSRGINRPGLERSSADVRRVRQLTGPPLPTTTIAGFAHYKGQPVLVVGHVAWTQKRSSATSATRGRGYRKALAYALAGSSRGRSSCSSHAGSIRINPKARRRRALPSTCAR